MRIFAAAVMLLAATLSASAQSAVPPDVLKDLAPTGKLRAAINFGNGVLAQKGKDGTPQGVTADLSRELAKRLGVEVDFVTFEAAGKVFEAAKAGAWDVGYVAIEPVRAALIEFTAAYVLIDGTYMVRNDSPLKEVGDVDKPGIKIAVGLGSGYVTYLKRTLNNATVVEASVGGGHANIELFVNDKLDAVAGVRQAHEVYAHDHPEMRVMSGAFLQIKQAMGTPKGRTAGAAYLAKFVEEMKASGFVPHTAQRNSQV